MTTRRESISGWLYDALASLAQGDQEESELHVSALMGDIRSLLKPARNFANGSQVSAYGFPGDQHGLGHADLQHLEAGILKAQSYLRARDLKSAAAAIKQAFDDWTAVNN